jgi:predicted metal-binding membrane protein
VKVLGLDGCDTVPILQAAAQSLGVRRGAYLAGGMLALSVLMIVVGVSPLFNSCMIGLLYPIYKTQEAIDGGSRTLMIN